MKAGNGHDSVPNGKNAILKAILDADVIVIFTPTYSHQPPGVIKALFDRIGGPNVGASFAELVRQEQAAGDPKFANMKFDPRLQRSRVVGFMAICGFRTTDQFTMALPNLHVLVYRLHADVVNQFIGREVAARGSDFLQPEFMERARQLGRNIVSQMGNDPQYGPKDKPSCANCHLTKIELLDKDKSIGCITCSTRGKMIILPKQEISFDWEENSIWSCITMEGKSVKFNMPEVKHANIYIEKPRWKAR